MNANPRPEAIRRAPPEAGDPDLADVRAAQVDPAAFDRLYRRYVDRVYSYAFSPVG